MIRNDDRIHLAWGPALLLLLLPLAAAPADAADEADEAEGKRLYVEYECNKCHAMASKDIELIEMEEDEEEDDGWGDDPFYDDVEEEEEEAEDLSGVGLEWNQDDLMDWLMKKLEKDGDTHRKKFKGTKKELKKLTAWLVTCKDEVPVEE